MSVKANMDQEISNIPVVNGPHDGAREDGLVSDGVLCGKVYFSESYENFCHAYELTYNNDDGYKFIYIGLKPYTQDEDGNYEIGEDE